MCVFCGQFGDPEIEEVRRRVDRAGGVMIAAHPFRGLAATSAGKDNPLKLADSVAGYSVFRYVDELEVLNGTSGAWERKLGWAVADRLDMEGTGGSDAHGVTAVGACFTRFQKEIRSEEELIQEIKGRRFKAGNDLIFQ